VIALTIVILTPSAKSKKESRELQN
jgi:hypothetical protein